MDASDPPSCEAIRDPLVRTLITVYRPRRGQRRQFEVGGDAPTLVGATLVRSDARPEDAGVSLSKGP